MIVIGDIAGQYKALIALLRKCPDRAPLSVGDMIDRGPDSKRVISYFMEYDGQALLGNHEHMMIDAVLGGNKIYEPGIWEMNGGDATKDNYPIPGDLEYAAEWMTTLDREWYDDDFYVSHTFQQPYSVGEIDLWGRQSPVPQDKFQLAGHNSQFGLRLFFEAEPEEPVRAYALCLDATRQKQIAAFDTETHRIYTQEYC